MFSGLPKRFTSLVNWCLSALCLFAVIYGLWMLMINPYRDYLFLDWWQGDYFALGQYYFNHGDLADGTYDIERAEYYYGRALGKDPNQHPLLWHQLGRIHFLNGEFDQAISAFEEQLARHGDAIPNVYYMLALTYGYQARAEANMVAWQKAEENFLTYLTYDPLSPWARVDLSWVFFAQGKYEDMLPILEVGLTHHPDNPWLLNMYGLALLNTNDSDRAQQYFLWASQEAYKLTVDDWGKSYPGNDPAQWKRGLAEFREAIGKNLELIINN